MDTPHFQALLDMARSMPKVLLHEHLDGGLHLEVCPSSNVQTGAASSVAAHQRQP